MMLKKVKSKFTPEEINLKGSKLKKKIIDLIQEGTARHIVIKREGKSLLEIPLTIGLGSATAAILINAPLTAIIAITAMTSNVKIEVYREKESL